MNRFKNVQTFLEICQNPETTVPLRILLKFLIFACRAPLKKSILHLRGKFQPNFTFFHAAHPQTLEICQNPETTVLTGFPKLYIFLTCNKKWL